MVKQTVKEISIDDLMEVIDKLPSSELKNAWLGWLSEYDAPGFYKRQPNMNYNARFMYMHNASPTGLLWLIQSLGVDQELVKLAEADYKQVKQVSEDKHSQSAAIRKRVPWEMVDCALTERLLTLDKAYKRKVQRFKKAAS